MVWTSISETCTGHPWIQEASPAWRVNIIKDGKRYLVADLQSISNRWKNNFSQLLNVHGVNDVRQSETHTAEPLLPEPRAFEVVNTSFCRHQMMVNFYWCMLAISRVTYYQFKGYKSLILCVSIPLCYQIHLSIFYCQTQHSLAIATRVPYCLLSNMSIKADTRQILSVGS
jgi:hypothetical protein